MITRILGLGPSLFKPALGLLSSSQFTETMLHYRPCETTPDKRGCRTIS